MAQRQVNPYLFVGRIVGILGISVAIAVVILALLGALWILAIGAFVIGIPFAAILIYTERSAPKQAHTE